MHHHNVPSWMTEYQLAEPLRTPPVVTAIVQGELSSWDVNDYKPPATPLPADGPPPITLHHKPGVDGHVDCGYRNPCGQCGRDVAQVLLHRLGVGECLSNSLASIFDLMIDFG